MALIVKIQHSALLILCHCLLFIFAYDVPPAKVEVFYPKGFRVSIPGKYQKKGK